MYLHIDMIQYNWIVLCIQLMHRCGRQKRLAQRALRQRLVRTAKSICVELGGRFYGVNHLIKWVFSMDSMFSMGIPGS